MIAVHVFIYVNPEDITAFSNASIENARNSRKEPGIARFDVIQQSDDPARFVLVEVYRNTDAMTLHKETGHYRRWKDTVASMMKEPRSSIKYETIDPPPSEW